MFIKKNESLSSGNDFDGGINNSLKEGIRDFKFYIKDNDLTNDMEVLGLLYGHICHYVMDETVHPLIKNISKNCLRSKRNHTLIEGYYDSYLVNKKLNISIDKYDNKFVLSGNVNNKIAKIIDYAYFSTYGVAHISRYYKFNIWLYRKIKYLYKLFSLNFLKKVLGFNNFILNIQKNRVYIQEHK